MHRYELHGDEGGPTSGNFVQAVTELINYVEAQHRKVMLGPDRPGKADKMRRLLALNYGLADARRTYLDQVAKFDRDLATLFANSKYGPSKLIAQWLNAGGQFPGLDEIESIVTGQSMAKAPLAEAEQ